MGKKMKWYEIRHSGENDFMDLQHSFSAGNQYENNVS